MITEKGLVQEVGPSTALVLVHRSSACARCHSQVTCGSSKHDEMLVEVTNEMHAQTGDWVQISVPARSLLKATFIVYILPVLALLTGTILGSKLASPIALDESMGAVLCGVLCMVTVFGIVKWYDTHAKPHYRPRITEITRSTTEHADNRQSVFNTGH